MRRAVVVSSVLVLLGCAGQETDPAMPCITTTEVLRPIGHFVDKVDLLFMIDNSNSTTEEQTRLVEQLPRLVEALTAGDVDPDDGIDVGRDFQPIRSLNLGVITGDMGTEGRPVPTCDLQPLGEDGVLRTWGNTAVDPTCPTSYPSFLGFAPGLDDAASFITDASCLAVVGTSGCGFEQPLEAILKAVTPSGQAPVGAFDGQFAMGTTGHADGANAGFLRPDSLLVVVAMTDEDDCSALDPELYRESSSIYPGELNLRCFEYPSALQPIERYVDGLLTTRASPDQLVFVPLAGIPRTAAGPPEQPPDYDAILSHPEMQVAIDPDMPTRLRPSCHEAGAGFAFPPRRIIEVAAGLAERGASTAAPSVCEPDFTEAADAIIHAMAGALVSCFARAPEVGADGRVECEMIETLPVESGLRCEDLPGRTLVRVDDDSGAEECLIEQLVTDGAVPAGDGWYVDTFSPLTLRGCAGSSRPARLAFTEGAAVMGAWRLECVDRVCDDGV
jgi:hypothetical protein